MAGWLKDNLFYLLTISTWVQLEGKSHMLVVTYLGFTNNDPENEQYMYLMLLKVVHFHYVKLSGLRF